MGNWLMIMEFEKSHNLFSASWRPRKACDVIPLKSEGLKGSPSLRAGEGKMSRQTGNKTGAGKQETKRHKYLLPQPFALFRPSIPWMRTTQIEEGNLLY